jgi:hypothetical protein
VSHANERFFLFYFSVLLEAPANVNLVDGIGFLQCLVKGHPSFILSEEFEVLDNESFWGAVGVLSDLVEAANVVLLCPFAESEAREDADDFKVEHDLVDRMRGEGTAFSLLVVNHVNCQWLAAVGHVFPPLDFVEAIGDSWGHFGLAVITQRVEPSELGLGKTHFVVLSALQDTCARFVEVSADRRLFDRVIQEGVTHPEMDDIHGEENKHFGERLVQKNKVRDMET